MWVKYNVNSILKIAKYCQNKIYYTCKQDKMCYQHIAAGYWWLLLYRLYIAHMKVFFQTWYVYTTIIFMELWLLYYNAIFTTILAIACLVLPFMVICHLDKMLLVCIFKAQIELNELVNSFPRYSTFNINLHTPCAVF